MMAAGSGDFEHPARAVLVYHIAHIRIARRFVCWQRDAGRNGSGPVEMGAKSEEIVGCDDATGGNPCRQWRTLRCNHQAASGTLGGACRGHHPGYAAQRAIQCEFAKELVARQALRWNLSGCTENSECNRQIETAALLGQVGRCEIDCDAPIGKFKMGIQQRATHPVPTFAHSGFRQTDNVECGQPVRQMSFNLHQRCVDARERATVND